MTHKRLHISIEELRQLLSYNPETGMFVWRERGPEWFMTTRHMNIWNRRYANKIAGSNLTSGYHGIRILHKAYKSHRIAWALHYGEWPGQDIDHINNDPMDNRIENLRLCTRQQNGCNKSKMSGVTSSYKGVSWKKSVNKWVAQICTKGRVKYLGVYHTEEEAHKAYVRAATVEHGEFAHF